jgi:hypothetical protein
MRKSVSISVVVLAFCAVSQAATWNVPGDFATILEAINSTSVVAGDTILVGAGNHAGAVVSKSVEIKGEDGAVINSGPAHGSGLIQGFRLIGGSDGATISHLTFTVDLAIMNGAAVSNVTVDNCTFLNTIQAVSNWRGDGWLISHNVIADLRTRCGGGIGILIGTVTGNVVSHNKISGTLHVSEGDCGEYNGSGIVLYADFRWGALGAAAITNNSVTKNKVSLVSDTPAVVDVCAFELTEAYLPEVEPPPFTYCIFDNSVGFNDFRDMALQIVLTPEDLDDYNDISRNLGENRGHGLHPSAFGIAD